MSKFRMTKRTRDIVRALGYPTNPPRRIQQKSVQAVCEMVEDGSIDESLVLIISKILTTQLQRPTI